jgi:hypothetical protein
MTPEAMGEELCLNLVYQRGLAKVMANMRPFADESLFPGS